MKTLLIFGICLFVGQGCLQRQVPPPERVSLESLAAAADSPARSASMRLVLQGNDELKRGRFERAAQLMTQAIEIDPQNPFAYYYLGLARFESSRFAQSSELFHRAGELFSKQASWQAESLARQGESLEKLNQIQQARNAYTQAARLDGWNRRAQSGLDRTERITHE